MAEGMEVDPAPAVRDKKRFEVKKVSLQWEINIFFHVIKSVSPPPLSHTRLIVECSCIVVVG